MSKTTYVYQGEDNKAIKLKEFQTSAEGEILNLGVPTVTPIQPNERRISTMTIPKTLLSQFYSSYASEVGLMESSGYFTSANEYTWNCNFDWTPNQKIYIIGVPIFKNGVTTEQKQNFLANFNNNGAWNSFFKFIYNTSTDNGANMDRPLVYNGDIDDIKFCAHSPTLSDITKLVAIKINSSVATTFYSYSNILENVLIDVMGVVDELEIPNTTKTATTEIIPFKPLLDTSNSNSIGAYRSANRLFEKYFNVKDNSTSLKLKWFQDKFNYPSLQIPTMYDITLSVIANTVD